AAERAGFPRRPLAGRAAALALVTAGFLVPASPYILALHDAVSRTDPSGGTWRLTLKKHERHLVGIPDPNPREQVAPVASDLATLLAPPARASAEVGTASAVLVAARKTADAVHPLIIVLGALGLAWCLGARLAHAPALATLGAFFCAHVLLRRNEGYLSKEHAAGEAAIVLAWAGAGAIALADRGATLLRSSRARSLAPAAVVLLGLAVLLPKTLERREAVKNDAERAVARAIAARWATVQEREPSRELLLCGNEAHVRSVAFLAGGRLVDLPRGDAAQVVSSARARGVSFLVLHARSHDDAARDRLLAAREALARAGLSSPLAFEGSRPDPEGGSVVYTWLLYELPRRSP
ncbi:hypothetical protein HY251_12225, partial [bacterium]|nr:hypothetical protein [bacterium]